MKKKRNKFVSFLLFILFNIATIQAFNQDIHKRKANVLMIVVDDLRTELNCYGSNQVITPNIDKLSEEGITFLNAYCQKSICVPSRQSFLTGTRPNTFGAEFETHFRTKLPNCITLPQQFMRNGYWTESIGKVFHHRDDISWNIPSWVPFPKICYPIYKTKQNIDIQKERIKNGTYSKKGRNWWAYPGDKWVPASIWEAPDVEDDQLTDGMIAKHAIERLKNLKDTTFFMAVGFFRPHIPFIAPSKYYDLYPLNSIHLPKNRDLPVGAPDIAANPGGEWKRYANVEKNRKKMPDEKTQKEYIRGYLASISYVDAQIGKLLNCLENLKLENNTIVVLFSDHGYHLFDKATFGKQTNFENGTRVPLIIRQPSNQISDTKCHSMIELIDIYPTLCEMVEISIPLHVQGKSFLKSLANPSYVGKEATAYSQYERNGFKGISIRTARYRLTEWKGKNETYHEFYDYEKDPTESRNKFDDPCYADTIAKMSNLLHDTFY